MARPTKLTRALLDKLDGIADDQWSIKDACAELGIDPATWRRWEASTADDELHAQFRALASRVRAGAGEKVDELAWGALREVLEAKGEWVTGPDGEREYVPGARHADKVAAAAAVLRLRTAHRVEVTGRDGGPVTLASLVKLAASDG